MASSQKKAVIYISPLDKSIRFYSMEEERITHDAKSYRANDFSAEFYQIFKQTLAEFSQKYTPASVANTTIVLPDYMVFTDVFSFPTIRNTSVKNYVQRHITGLYKNPKELKINTYTAVKNKQTTTCVLSGIRNSVLSDIKAACLEGRMMAQNITFAANTTVNAIDVLEPKLLKQTYLLLDVKENYTRFVYVFNGRAVGFYSLPFGLEVLERDKLAAEDLLMSSPIAELAVLNAKEKARAKQLTMMGGAPEGGEAEGGEKPEGAEGAESEKTIPTVDTSITHETTVKSMPKKVARKLPKYMLREAPTTPEQLVYENFRIFEKWALCFLAGNSRMTAMHPPAGVYVNLPDKFHFLFDMVNAEESENGIKFFPCDFKKHKGEIVNNLEMYGGLFSAKMNVDNNF